MTFKRGLLIRNGRRERRKTVSRCDGDVCTYRETITVPAGHVYVAGDNRGSSDDSRIWGALPIDQLVGRYVRTCQEFAETPGATCTTSRPGSPAKG